MIQSFIVALFLMQSANAIEPSITKAETISVKRYSFICSFTNHKTSDEISKIRKTLAVSFDRPSSNQINVDTLEVYDPAAILEGKPIAEFNMVTSNGVVGIFATDDEKNFVSLVGKTQEGSKIFAMNVVKTNISDGGVTTEKTNPIIYAGNCSMAPQQSLKAILEEIEGRSGVAQ